MKHFILGENIGLISIRQVVLDKENYNHILVSDTIIDRRVFLSNRSAGVIFPLYQYIENKITKEIQKVPNIKKKVLDLIKQKYNATPEDFLYYIYAILHDPSYREKYKEFLKIDFPRIPLYNKEKFEKYKEIGKELVELHLMKREFTTVPKINGNSLKVDKIRYDDKNQRVWINKTTYLDEIPKEVWKYKIGGYRVIEKYLKSRKGRELSINEIEHVFKVVEIVKETLKLIKKLKELS